MRRLLVTSICAAMLAACGSLSSASSTCALGPEFESSVVATDVAFDDFSQTTPRQMQSTMSVLLLSLSRMREVAPSSLDGTLATIERAYSEISIALQSISWDTAIADADPLVAQSLQVLSRAETIQAMSDLRDFFRDSCKAELKALPARDATSATTLPTPLTNIDPDSFNESSADFDTEQSALRSYGLYVAEQIGETVTNDQAVCLGAALLDVADRATPLNDNDYEAFVLESLQKCVE